MKRSIVYWGFLALFVPLLFMGCSGDDGAQGPPGPPGPAGSGGGTGAALQSNETCFLCHGAGNPFDVNKMHRLNTATGNPLPPGSASITINSVEFGAPAGDNVPVTVNFTFQAFSADRPPDEPSVDITSQIDLRTKTGPSANDNLAFVSFLLAKFVPGQTFPAGGKDADEWNGFIVNPGASGSSPFRANRPDNVAGAVFTRTGPGDYSYTFPTSAVRISDGYDNTALMRAGVQFSIGNPNAVNSPVLNLFTTDPYYQSFPRANRRRPVANAILDVVPPAGGVGTGEVPDPGDFPIKKDVSTAACNACHDPLAIHGGGRREYQFCQICHNAKTEIAAPGYAGFDNTNLVNLVHKLHGRNPATGAKLDLGPSWVESNGQILGAEITYPQDIRNCTRCHQGTEIDNTYANWQLRPTRTACGSCHINVNFDTGAGHGPNNVGGAQPTNALCILCHGPNGPAPVMAAHATENATPNNPQLPPTLVSFEYGIDNVTVDDNNVATIKFWIKQDNVFIDFNRLGDNTITRPVNTAGGPSFLFAYALPLDGVNAPEDYNNLGRPAGQPASLSIIGLPIVDNVGTSQYTVQRADAFPPEAQMRAVALQGYFTQMLTVDYNGDGTVNFLDNVGRHTFSVVRAVTGDRERRVAVESGYTNNNNPFTGIPVGCLECHEIFEGHGGNRVSNAQVCVMCHNPNLSSSARTFGGGSGFGPLTNADIIADFGTDPLTFPEVTNNFKELIHGLHGRDKRTTNFIDIRNRNGGVLVEGDEITFPGEPSHCGKCHKDNRYQNIQTTGRSLSTVVTTTGADNTAADVVAARNSMPNATDLVNTPATSACGHCHDSDVARNHFIAMGGAIRTPRGAGVFVPPPLHPAFEFVIP